MAIELNLPTLDAVLWRPFWQQVIGVSIAASVIVGVVLYGWLEPLWQTRQQLGKDYAQTVASLQGRQLYFNQLPALKQLKQQQAVSCEHLAAFIYSPAAAAGYTSQISGFIQASAGDLRFLKHLANEKNERFIIHHWQIETAAVYRQLMAYLKQLNSDVGLYFIEDFMLKSGAGALTLNLDLRRYGFKGDFCVIDNQVSVDDQMLMNNGVPFGD